MPGLFTLTLCSPWGASYQPVVLAHRYRGHVDLRGFLPPPPMLPTPAAAESAATHGAHAERPAKHRKLGGQGEGAASIAGTDGAADQPQGPSGGGLLPQRVPGDVPRLDARGMAPEDFHRLLDGRCLPALLTGLTEGWPGGWLGGWVQVERLVWEFGGHLCG